MFYCAAGAADAFGQWVSRTTGNMPDSEIENSRVRDPCLATQDGYIVKRLGETSRVLFPSSGHCPACILNSPVAFKGQHQNMCIPNEQHLGSVMFHICTYYSA